MKPSMRGAVSNFLKEHEGIVMKKNSRAYEFDRQLRRSAEKRTLKDAEEARGVSLREVEVYGVACCGFDQEVSVCRLEVELRLPCWVRVFGLLTANEVEGCAKEIFRLGDHLAVQPSKVDQTSAGGPGNFLASSLHSLGSYSVILATWSPISNMRPVWLNLNMRMPPFFAVVLNDPDKMLSATTRLGEPPISNPREL